MNEKQAAKQQADNLARILNESFGIMNTTKNLDTLKSRASYANTCINDLDDLVKKGLITVETPPDETRKLMWFGINERLEELSILVFDDILAKNNSYSSVKSAIGAISKVQRQLIEYKEALYKEGSNYTKTIESISKMHNKLQEEVFSGQLKIYLEKADKEEFKGNTKKAKDYYLDALHHIKTAGIDISKYKKDTDKIAFKIEKLS